MSELPQSSIADGAKPLSTDEYVRQYYYAQWQQYYANLWQQYYLQQQRAYGSGYRPAGIQSSPQPAYSHGGYLEDIPDVPQDIQNKTKEIFISYSTKNSREASFVCRKMEASGMRCWIAPRDLLPGTNFADNIEMALDNAKLLILILSRESVNSPWVEGEVNTAFSAGMPILVYQIDDVMPDGAFKIMIEKFPTLCTCGNIEKDAATLVYNAMVFTGRMAAPKGGFSTKTLSKTKGQRPSVHSVRSAQKKKPVSEKRNTSGVLWAVVICVLCIVVTVLSAPFWFPLIQSLLPVR